MQNSVFIAKLIGPIIAVMGVSLLINREAFNRLADDILDSPGTIIMIGVTTMLAGLSLVLTHNIWTGTWPVAITLFGWITVIVGLIRILTPTFVQKMGRALMTKSVLLQLATPIWIGFGLWLSYHGYIA